MRITIGGLHGDGAQDWQADGEGFDIPGSEIPLRIDVNPMKL